MSAGWSLVLIACRRPLYQQVPEVMVLDVDVFSVGVHLWDLGSLQSSTVVLKNLTMDNGLGGYHIEALQFQFLDQLHQWDGGL